jgi:arginine decarboxylase
MTDKATCSLLGLPMDVNHTLGARQSYRAYLRSEHGFAGDGPLTDFVSLRDGRLVLGDQVDLNGLVQCYDAPLELAFCPLIAQQIRRMQGWAAYARQTSGYGGGFVYAYATKANYAAEAVRAALAAGAHYETSATADVWIAQRLWQSGLLPGDRYIFCNGSKSAAYLQAVMALREAGHARVVPILDDLAELDVYLTRDLPPLLLGVRERRVVDPDCDEDERFGLTAAEIAIVAARLEDTPHRLIVYHTMLGSQIEHAGEWTARLTRSAEAYCRLRQRLPSLHMFNIGGGMPTSAYRLDFEFDYPGFLAGLMRALAASCAAYDVPQPDIVGEFGRYTVASHSVSLMRVGAVKAGRSGGPDWYLLDGSLMLALPDILLVPGQQFMVLPLNGWDLPATKVRLAGRHTCDSGDCYPQRGQPPLILPAHGEGLVIAMFGVGAYQQALSGRGGVHHCLAPEPRRIVIESGHDGLVLRESSPPSLEKTMALLGYEDEVSTQITLARARSQRSTLFVPADGAMRL